MFRVGKSNRTEAPEQPAAAQRQTAQQPAPTIPEARREEATPQQQGAEQPQQQQRAQVEPQTLVSRAVSESESLARAVKEGAVGGFVGGTSALTGEINFRGMMRVDGKVMGRVVSEEGTLIVSSGGRVEAEVSVAVARISGEVMGDITAAERVELGRTARVSGNIQTPALVVEDGAIFEGNCRMSQLREGRPGEEKRRSKNAA